MIVQSASTPQRILNARCHAELGLDSVLKKNTSGSVLFKGLALRRIMYPLCTNVQRFPSHFLVAAGIAVTVPHGNQRPQTVFAHVAACPDHPPGGGFHAGWWCVCHSELTLLLRMTKTKNKMKKESQLRKYFQDYFPMLRSVVCP